MASNVADSISTPYFPQAKSDPAFLPVENVSVERPREVGPILSPDYVEQPIISFDEKIHDTLYPPALPSNKDEKLPRPIPPKPEDFSDPYLFPVLSKQERLRLTMLWYYTRDITNDAAFLAKLNGLVNMVQQFMGWEFAIMGLLDEAIYTRLATANLPIALLPRRESTCAHTINQPTGDVYMLTNMLEDWRFSESPHVRLGGLRSYAGVPLRLKSTTGEHVALGSLCIASNSVQDPLTADQQSNLVRFADILTSELVIRRRTVREHDRAKFQQIITTLPSRGNGPSHIKDSAIEALVHAYPDAIIRCQRCQDNYIQLENRPAIHVSEVQNELWEDVNYIDTAIQTLNFKPLESMQTVRAIISRCGPGGQFLTVLSRDMHFVFDDIDAWFVNSCAMAVSECAQEEALREALEAKTRFLRGITHQLRTPIHGVLVSAELLSEELASLGPRAGKLNDPSNYLDSIKSSGRELMTTVNNILKLNNWSDSATMLKTTPYDLNALEDDVLTDVLHVIPEDRLREVVITVNNNLPVDRTVIITDASLLKECIESLVLNALQAITRGKVEVSMSMSADGTILSFDIIDTGCGMKAEDHKRIFESYEKIDVHTAGAGLGLTIASKIVAVMHGSVKLVSSIEGAGSHFRVEFRNPVFSNEPKTRKVETCTELRFSPRTFSVFPDSNSSSALVECISSFLEHHKFHKCDSASGSLIIFGHVNEDGHIPDAVKALRNEHVIICLGVSSENQASIRIVLGHHRVLFITGPLYQSRLEEILKMVESRYEEIAATSDHADQANSEPNSITNGTFSRVSSISTSASRVVQLALLVDDNAINLRILRMYCEKRKLPYVTAIDGNEAVKQFKEAATNGPISITLLDLQMPLCDGAEACAQIRAWEVERGMQRSIIFIVTGQDNVQDRTRSMEAGADEFFVKPVSLTLLDRGVNKYFPGQCPVPK